MLAQASLIPELEDAIRRGPVERRVETLERVTRLFIDGSERLSDDQVVVFDDVLGRLIQEIESRALVELSRRLAPIENAPPKVVRRLARNTDIAVAGPMLEQSPQLDLDDLVDIASTHGQDHLLAISNRKTIDEPVTDVLVQRGDREVVRCLAGNNGARISDTGFAALVKRAGQDGILAEQVGKRGDIPKPLFRRLVMQATAVVQARLMAAADEDRRAEIRQVLSRVADEYGANGERRDYSQAKERVGALRKRDALGEHELAKFARARDHETTVAALAELCDVPLDVVDRLVGGDRPDPILILCKAMRFNWTTTAAVLSLRVMPGSPTLDTAAAQFDKLSASTAQRVVQFWRARPNAGVAMM